MQVIIRTSPAFNPKDRHYSELRRAKLVQFSLKNEELSVISTKHIGSLCASNAYNTVFRTNLSSEMGFKLYKGVTDKYIICAISLRTGEAFGDLLGCDTLVEVRCEAGRVVTKAVIISKQ